MEINVPAKVLSISISSTDGLEEWPYDDGKGDPFWSGGPTPRFYQWTMTGTVTVQTHGSHLTREPGEYNGLDIYTGDYIVGATTGKALKVISVNQKTTATFDIVVEDEYRYNTFRSSTGNGSFTGPAVVCVLNSEGSPVLDPLPTGIVSSDFFPNSESRFDAFRLRDTYPLYQESNGFLPGDPIAIDKDTGLFELADSDSYDRLVGSVSDSGPGPNQFLLTPTTKVIEGFLPPLPGDMGDFIYADPDNPGTYTTDELGREMFLQLSDPIPSSIDGTVIAATVSIGNVMAINGTDVTFTGTTIASVVADINLLTGSHGITASPVLTPTSVTTNAPDLNYGLVGNFTDPPGPASATINGTLVTFSDDTDGLAEYVMNVAINSDMARSINTAAIANIIATFAGAGVLTLDNSAGGAITIVNVDSDTSGIPFAGPASGTGLALSTPASTDTVINLSGLKGEGVILQNVVGDPIGDLGLISVDNGQLPIALVIEQGIRKGDMFVVADITARDNLAVLIGDQAHVLNKGDGEWGLFLYDGTVWTQVATEESARVDSRTLTDTVDFTTGSPVIMGEVSPGVRVTPVTIEVITPFDGAPTISVGDVGDPARLFDDSLVDLSSVGIYTSTPSYVFPGPNDDNIIITFTGGGSTTGQAKVTITYS